MPRYGPGQSGPAPPKRRRARKPAAVPVGANAHAHAGGGGLAPVSAPKRHTPAQGGAVLRRGTFQPENRRQQSELSQGSHAEGRRVAAQKRRERVQKAAISLYRQGRRKEAINLAQREGLGIASPGPLGKYIERTGADLGQAAFYTPGGLYAAGSAVGKDTASAATRGDYSFKRSRKMGTEIGKQTVESFTHPGRHPGYTLLNTLALLSAGAGAASRVGAAGEALRSGEGVGAAVARPGFKGGSLVHKKAPGEINLPGGAQALEPDNPLLRPVKRARMKRVTKTIEQGRAMPGPTAARRHLGAQNVVGRELRAREQVQADIAQAPIEAMKQRVKRLTPEENTALRVIATEGSHALRHPEETIGRHVQTHLANAEQGIAPKLNREIAKDLQKALPVLKEKRPEFMRAVASARRVSKRSEGELVGGERLTQEAADARRAKIAQAYGHKAEPPVPTYAKPTTALKVPPNTTLWHTTRRASEIRSSGLRASPHGESGPGVYLTDDPAFRDRMTSWEKTSGRGGKEREALAVKTARPLRLLNRDTPEGERLFRKIQLDATISGKGAQAGLMPGLKAAGYDGVRYTSGKDVEVVVHDPSALKIEPPHQGAPPKGSFYFPTGERFKFPTKPLKGGAVSRHASEHGLGPVDASRYLEGTTRRFTGKGLKTGVVQRPGEAIASRATGTAKLASAERVHGSLLKLATPERRSEFDIPIRATRQISQADRRKVAAALEEAQTGDKTALVRSENAIKDALSPREGEKAVYLDRRYLKEITGGTASRVARAGAVFNKPFRLGGVYLRPAYVATNRPQNFLMRHLQQGLRTKKPIRGTVGHMRRQMGEELVAKIDAATGETRTEAFVPQGLGGRFERAVTGKVSSATDRSERFLAFLARAHEKGYRSEADLRRLFADKAPEKVVNDRVAISRRASKDMVDFRSVTPGEHEISDLIYFYPWLSRATGWSARFAANHPVKSAALASVAPTGEQEQRKALGPVPGWLKGFIPTSKGLVNPASVNTFETPAQIGQYLANPTGPQASSFGEEFGTPVVQAMTTPPSQWGKKAMQSQAFGLMAQRLGLVGKPPKTFPKTGVGPALGPFTFGGLYPRAADKAAIAKQAVTDLNPVERIKARHTDYGKKILEGAIKTGLLPKGAKLTPELTKALAIRTARYVNRAKMGADGTGKTRERFAADVRFLEQRKIIPAAKADKAVKWAKGEKRDYLVEKELRHLSDWYFDDLYGHAFADARQKLRDRGYDLPRLP